jgi:hypothetical protein
VFGPNARNGRLPRRPGWEHRAPDAVARVAWLDDNPINQKVGLSLLGKLGYRADLATNGREVLQALERKVYENVVPRRANAGNGRLGLRSGNYPSLDARQNAGSSSP